MKFNQLNEILPTWKPDTFLTCGDLTLAPLLREGASARYHGYLLVSEAIDADALVVTRFDTRETDATLLVQNNADQPVLLTEHDAWPGAQRENHMLRASVLLPPRAQSRIPVRRLEDGRWDDMRSFFETRVCAPTHASPLEHHNEPQILKSYGLTERHPQSSQDRVSGHPSTSHNSSMTPVAHDAMETPETGYSRYREALPCPSGASGVIAAVRGRLLALDAFDAPSTLDAMWPRLIDGYAMDAEAMHEPQRKPFTKASAETILEHIGERQYQTVRSVGTGNEIRLESTLALGRGLHVDDHLVHLSIVPRVGRRAQRWSTMMPPTQPPMDRDD